MIDSLTLRSKAAKPAAWGLLILIIILAALATMLFFLNRHTPVPPSWGFDGGPRAGIAFFLVYSGGLLLYGLLCASIGALIIGQRPSNPIGWLLSAAGLAIVLNMLSQEYTILANFTAPGRWPAGAWAALAASNVWVFTFWSLLWLIALFPDGRLPSPRWRWVPWLNHLFVIITVGSGLSEDPMSSGFYLPNPLPIAWPGWFSPLLSSLAIMTMALAFLSVLFLVVTRFRRSRGVERQQFKWLALAALLTNAVLLLGLALGWNAGAIAGQVMINYSVIFLPLGIGVAILRYRLYDIDIIIRRTLIYTALTVALGLFYFGAVILLQSAFRVLAGQSNQLAIVISTLLIAALFVPLRRRIQAAIDHRFYRRKYDAGQILATFSQATRDEVDLSRLTEQLLEVVQETVQPANLSLWLRPVDGRPPAVEKIKVDHG
jgi:hypothetical protein